MPLHRKSLVGLCLLDPVCLCIYRINFIFSGQSSVFDLISFPSTLSLNVVSDSARGRIVRSYNQKSLLWEAYISLKKSVDLKIYFWKTLSMGFLKGNGGYFIYKYSTERNIIYLIYKYLTHEVWVLPKQRRMIPWKQIHFLSFMKELQVRMLGGLKHFIPSSNHQQLRTIRIYGPRLLPQ